MKELEEMEQERVSSMWGPPHRRLCEPGGRGHILWEFGKREKLLSIEFWE